MAKKAIRPIRIEGNIAYVPLTMGYEAIIDAADVPLVSAWNWSAGLVRRKDGSISKVYAMRTEPIGGGKRRTVRMHSAIAQTPDGLETDHINLDGLDNRRSNLRAATSTQNRRNIRAHFDSTTGVKGVTWHKPMQKWVAKIRANGRRVHLGYFATIEAAAAAYAKASAEHHGVFGRTA